MAQNDFIGSTIDSIFAQHNKSAGNAAFKSKNSVERHQLEVALTVILVDLASADQSFESREYFIIENGLRRLFGTPKLEVSKLVAEAQSALANLRGTGKFTTELKDTLTLEQKKVAMEVIDDVISADGVLDGFEIYLRNRFAASLGLPLLDVKPQEE